MENSWSATRQQPIRVLVVDSCEMTCLLCKFLIEDWDDLCWAGAARNGEEALRLCGELQPDVVIMEAALPAMNGLIATSLIREQYPQVQVIVLSLCRYDDLPRAALEAGACGYIQKPSLDSDLVKMIRAAATAARTPIPC